MAEASDTTLKSSIVSSYPETSGFYLVILPHKDDDAFARNLHFIMPYFFAIIYCNCTNDCFTCPHLLLRSDATITITKIPCTRARNGYLCSSLC